MAILNRIFGITSQPEATKVARNQQADAASKEYLENQRIAAADTRIFL